MSHTLVGIQCVMEPLLRNLSVVSSLEFYEVIIYRQTIFLQSLTCHLYENKLVPNSLQDLKINKAVALPVGAVFYNDGLLDLFRKLFQVTKLSCE